MENITLKDIARLAGVSHTTVSRALNNSASIKDSTREKILDIAQKYNYVTNINAKSLVMNKSFNIGLFFTTIGKGTSGTFFHQIVEAVSKSMPAEYDLVVKGIDGIKNGGSISRRRFDGIIVVSQSKEDDAFIFDVCKEEIPLVVLNREFSALPVTNILSSDENGAFLATEYLINQGHNDIAIIKGVKSFESSTHRAEGFSRALLEHNIAHKKEFFVDGEYDIRSGYNAMEKLLNLKKKPTAVFCSNDDMAVGAIKAIADFGLKVPNDISIVGFDNSVVCDYITPALTSVKKPSEEISVKGLKKLFAIINKNEIPHPEKIYLDTELVIRDSVCNPDQ